jgi:hypothetical protein
VILTRKKLFTQATKNLEKAKKTWDGEEADLAQVRPGAGSGAVASVCGRAAHLWPVAWLMPRHTALRDAAG